MIAGEPEVVANWIEVEGVRTHYLAAGTEGPPVLLLHGGGLDSASLSYGPSLVSLAGRHRVFAPDWPGYGESDPPEEEITLEYYVHFLGSLMDALGVNGAALVGLSLGGGVALGFALRSPERVDRLVLVDSYGLGREIPYGVLSFLMVQLPLLNELTWWLLSRDPRLARKSLEGIFHDPQAIDEKVAEEVHQLMLKPNAGRAWEALQRTEASWNGLRTSYVDRLHELRTPTLILHGAQDQLVPVAWAERAHRLIPNSQLRIIEQCGHWPQREKPEEFLRAVSSFLAESTDSTR